MATVSLQTVFDEARRAIETGAADKAIGIAQHILVHFPRMIEGSRLLGEAYLNAGQPEPAAAAFAQVLQSDPENVAAYYGQGLALQSMEQRTAAITAFERALEIQPNLADLRTQLMRLYSETPGSAGQFRLSRVGLGRLYARGGMFSQAIDEFRAVLDVDPQRDDVKVALAEALWRDGQEDEATDFCRDVLEQCPELLKPTLLLGYMLFAGGQPEGETLWRRAGEQDATMAMARTLFDILPPIRIEEPVVPEFDEAEWRAKEARRAAEQPAQAPVASSTTDDDFFADSWLSSAGSASTAAAAATATQVYEPPSFTQDRPSSGGGSDSGDSDDDLLASLLGFGLDEPSTQQPSASSGDVDDVQPFALDDWDVPQSDDRRGTTEQLPTSLDDIGLEDAAPERDGTDVSVQPFSLDDWSFDDEPQRNAAVSQRSAFGEDFDLPNIAAFSLDDEDEQPGAVKPFSLDDEDEQFGAVKPFSLDDEDEQLGAVKPFSLDDEDEPGFTAFASEQNESQQASSGPEPVADSGLGAVQPFSLDDWGLDDNDASSTSQPVANQFNQQDDAADDLGNLKPFSLDELSLDTLEYDAPSALSGPDVPPSDEVEPERTTFSWEEPTWRAQIAQETQSSSDSDESIFAKLMRNRAATQESAETSSQDPASSAEAEAEFFSIDDETLRLDFDGIDEAASTSEFDDSLGDTSATARTSDVAVSGGEHRMPEAEASVQQFDQGTAGSLESDVEAVPFSIDDLESDAPSFDQPGVQESDAAVGEVQPDQDLVPFSLSELGLTDDELAALDDHPDLAADTPQADATGTPDTAPFLLADLGLSDDEFAVLNLGSDDRETTLTSANGELEQNNQAEDSVLADEASFEVGASNVEPDMTPFSLSELGLADDEIALFSEQGDDQPAERGGELDDTDQEWLDLQSELAVDLPPTRTPDDFLAEARSTDGDVQSVLETMPAEASDDDASDMMPFSLADLGLNDDEVSLFEELPAEQSSETPQSQHVDVQAKSGHGSGESDSLPEQQAAPFSLTDVDQSSEEQAAPFSLTDVDQSSEEQPTPFSLTDVFASDAQNDVEQPAALFASDDAETVPETANTGGTAAQPSSLTMDEAAPEDYTPPSRPESEVDDDQYDASVFGAISQAVSKVSDTLSAVKDKAGSAAEKVADVASTVTEHVANVASAVTSRTEGDPSARQPASPTDGDMTSSLADEQSQADPAAGVLQGTAVPEPDVAQKSAVAATDFGTVTSNQGLEIIHAQLAADPENDAMRLAAARMSQSTGDIGQAIEQYKVLIKRGHLVDDVVEDLQDTIADSDDPHVLRRLHRLLGDAYMKQNRFREAMDEYSWTSGRSS